MLDALIPLTMLENKKHSRRFLKDLRISAVCNMELVLMLGSNVGISPPRGPLQDIEGIQSTDSQTIIQLCALISANTEQNYSQDNVQLVKFKSQTMEGLQRNSKHVTNLRKLS